MNYLKHIISWNYYYNKVWKFVSWWYDSPDQHVIDFLDYIDIKKFKIEKVILDTNCYINDEVYYFYLIKI